MISLSRARFAAEMYWRRSLPLKHQSVDGSHKSKRERIVCAVRGWLPTLKHLPANARAFNVPGSVRQQPRVERGAKRATPTRLYAHSSSDQFSPLLCGKKPKIELLCWRLKLRRQKPRQGCCVHLSGANVSR